MKAIWNALWNNPVIMIAVITAAAVTIVQEAGDSLPTGWRVGLQVLIVVGGVLGQRMTVSPTPGYKEKVPADI
jgi:hypothetical protein